MNKNNTSLSLLFIANGISGFAQGVSMLSIPWYFVGKNNSSLFNHAYAALTFFIMFFGLYAGTLVDKFSRKNNFLFTSLICGVLIMGIALYGYYMGELPNALIIAVFAITMLNYNIHYPTLYAFGQEISSEHQYSRVNSNIEIVGQTSSILSGGFAAILLDGFQFSAFNIHFYIKAWQIYDVFMMDAITYFIAVVLIYFIPYKASKRTLEAGEGVMKRLRNGMVYLNENRNLFVFGICSYLVFAMLLVEIHAVLPTYIKQHLNEKGHVFALADTIYAVGALSAGLFVSKVFKKTYLVKSIIILTFGVVLIFLWAFATRSVLVLYIVSLILGFCNAGIRVLRLSYLFANVPNYLMGRVGSIFNLLNVFIRSIFIFVFSQAFFAYSNNMIYAYAIMAVFLLMAAFTMIKVQKRLTK